MSKVRKIGDKILRQKTEAVTEFNQELLDLIDEMTSIMREERGIGLAANQAGVSKAVCIIDTTQGTNPVEIFVNPEIIQSSDLIDFDEGCLSIPGITARTKRFNKVTVRFQDVTGHSREEELEGIRAVAIQHEVDHLNGKLYIDSLSRLKREMAMKKYIPR